MAITGANGSGTINSIGLWPTITVNGITYTGGNGGEASGGTLQKDMANNANGFTFVTYLGESDGNNLITAGGAALTYCGVPFSHTAIQEGSYTFWGYEHMYYLDPSFASFADAFATKIAGTTVTDSGLDGATMNVQRGPDGGLVTAIYF